MPTYEYECKAGHRFEVQHGINESLTVCSITAATTVCPEGGGAVLRYCGAPVKRLLFPVAGRVIGTANPCRGRR